MSINHDRRVVEARLVCLKGAGFEYSIKETIFFVEHSPVVSLCAKKTELYNTTNEK